MNNNNINDNNDADNIMIMNNNMNKINIANNYYNILIDIDNNSIIMNNNINDIRIKYE